MYTKYSMVKIMSGQCCQQQDCRDKPGHRLNSRTVLAILKHLAAVKDGAKIHSNFNMPSKMDTKLSLASLEPTLYCCK